MFSKFAFVFPGQGSQYMHMLDKLFTVYPFAQETLNEASEILGYDVANLIKTNPKDKLNQTTFTQPILLAASVTIWRIWKQITSILPIILAGHSLGEYSALVCAEALTFSDGLKLVTERASLMQKAVPNKQGAMAAILGLSDKKVLALCEAEKLKKQIIQVANFNAPGQVVIAGHRVAVEQFNKTAKAAGARRTILLPISVPAHCNLMIPAADAFRDKLQKVTWQIPKINVIHNVNVQTHQNVQSIINALIKQLSHPVRWVETIQYITKLGIQDIIECGPGNVLTNLNKRITSKISAITIGEKPDTIGQIFQKFHNKNI